MELNIHIFEMFGMIFTMTGAYFMSLNPNKVKAHMLYAFIAFGISNVFMLTVSLYENMLPLFIQMVFFGVSSYQGMKEFAPIHLNKDISEKFLSYLTNIITLGSIGVVFYLIYTGFNFEWKISILEIIAATMAVYGSFLLKSKDLTIKGRSFILFFIADILYVLIAYENSLYFFMVQSIFLVFTALKGYYETDKLKKYIQ